MKESTEQHHQHLVIRTTHLQSPMNNQPQKSPKTAQNGKGPPTSSPPSKSRGRRRRGRGERKSDQGDVCARPSSRPCTGECVVPGTPNVCARSAGGNRVDFPTSSRSLSLVRRPGYGQVGTKCIVKANHFFAELPEKDLNQYDVSRVLFSKMG